MDNIFSNYKNILVGSGKDAVIKLSRGILNSKNSKVMFTDYLDFALKDLKVYSARACRVCALACLENPDIMNNGDIHKVIKNIARIKNDGNSYSLLKLLINKNDICKIDNISKLWDFCENVLTINSESSSKAITIYSIELMYIMSSHFKELQEEFMHIIKNYFNVNKEIMAPSISSRIRKYLK